MEDQLLDESFQNQDQNPTFRFAGFWIRVGASLIDALVLLPFIALSMYNLYVLKYLSLQLVLSVLTMLYKPWMEYEKGATLGKMAVKVHLINQKGDSISLEQSLLRNSPWLASQVLSIFTTIILFIDPAFINANGMLEVSTIQQDSSFYSFNLILSLITLISCLTVAFTQRKQGLHDMIASTFCVYDLKR